MKLSRQFTRREKVLLMILVVMMMGAAYYLAVFQPVANAISKLRDERTVVEDQIVVLEAQELVLTQLRAELDEALKEPNVAEIPDYNNLQQLTTFLNTTLVATTDYTLNFQPPQVPEEGGSVMRRQISLNFTCSGYTRARNIITELHGSPYRCQLGDLTLTSAPDALDAPGGLDRETTPISVSLVVTFFEVMR